MRSVVLHTGKLLAELPLRWTVFLGNALRHRPIDDPDSANQLLGMIDFESREFRVCHEDEWDPSPFAMRVNVVFDAQMQFFSVTILDAPMGIKRISLVAPQGLQHLRSDESGTTFEFSICGEASNADNESLLAFSDLHALVAAQASTRRGHEGRHRGRQGRPL